MIQKSALGLIILLAVVGCGQGAHMPWPDGSSTPATNSADAPDGVEVSSGQPLSYRTDILPIIQKQCSICHNANSGPVMPNWLDYQTAASKKSLILQHVWVTRDMPLGGGTITDAERAKIRDWVVQGAPQ